MSTGYPGEDDNALTLLPLVAQFAHKDLLFNLDPLSSAASTGSNFGKAFPWPSPLGESVGESVITNLVPVRELTPPAPGRSPNCAFSLPLADPREIELPEKRILSPVCKGAELLEDERENVGAGGRRGDAGAVLGYSSPDIVAHRAAPRLRELACKIRDRLPTEP